MLKAAEAELGITNVPFGTTAGTILDPDCKDGCTDSTCG